MQTFHTGFTLKSLALGAISLYQRYLSPYKGFCCAYSAVTGHASCSTLGYRAIRRLGVWRGLGVLDRRLHRCGVASRRQQRPAVNGPLQRQAGFVDCGGCDAPGCDLPCWPTGACDAPSLGACGDLASCASNCGSPSCDWRRRQDDQYVVIPVRGDRQGGGR